MKLMYSPEPALSHPTRLRVHEGSPAPDFGLQSTAGHHLALSDHLGEWVVLYFYPEDGTPGCTLEAKRFRDYFESISRQQAVVIGISRDTHEKHCAFRDKHALPYELLSDTDGTVHDLYGAWRRPTLRRSVVYPRRCTFIIDPRGVVRKVYDRVNPATHAGEVVRDIERLAGLG